MRRSPEKLIARLRNRRVRIIGLGAASVLGLGLLAFACLVLVRLNAALFPKEGEDLLLHVVKSQAIVSAIVNATAISYLLAAVVGLLLGSLLTEAFMFTKNDLLVDLWDRVQALERSQTSARSSPIPNP